MKATDKFISQFEAPEFSDLLKLKYGNKVEVKSSYQDFIGEVTRSPYFTVEHVCNYPGSEELAARGAWWVEVDGKSYSLQDYNVIDNSYNNHSITLVKERVICEA